MKRKSLLPLLASVWMLSTLGASAQTFEDFNSRTSVAVNQVKNHLENFCSVFVGFDVNANGWNANIEGDGALVSENNPSPSYGTSPILQVGSSLTISFTYKFNNTIESGARRWLKIYLADGNNVPQVLLDSVEFENINTTTVYTYNKTLPTTTGLYKIYVSYSGIGGSAAIAIDELMLSASKLYENSCNAAPVAVNDNVTGLANRTASGMVNTNDSDPNGEAFTAYLITASPHGNVSLNANGSFTFSPNAGFAGSSTTFTYKICDQGQGVLCSNDATVTINFPSSGSGVLPVSLVDFNGFYKNDGKVELNWITNFEQNSDRFEVERSFDGVNWEKAGTLKAQGNSSVRKPYSYTDEVGRNTAIKKDLYYRLKQIDLDGKSAYTRILIVRVYNTHSIKMISVTPNPARNDISVNVQLNENSFIVMKVISSNGVEVVKKSVKASAGANSFMLEGTSSLQRGMYVLEVIVNSKERMIVKLIKE